MRAQGSCFLLVVRPVTADNPVLYRVRNASRHHTLYYRQADCDEYDWQELGPGGEVLPTYLSWSPLSPPPPPLVLLSPF